MTRFLAFFLTALMLLQILGQEVLVVDYHLNQARITEQYCVNKARPQLHCNGKCHLAKQLRKTESGDKKVPGDGVAKIKYEVLPTVAFTLLAPAHWQAARQPFPSLLAAPCVASSGVGVFRPPVLLA